MSGVRTDSMIISWVIWTELIEPIELLQWLK